jgi:hypothetical protein
MCDTDTFGTPTKKLQLVSCTKDGHGHSKNFCTPTFHSHSTTTYLHSQSLCIKLVYQTCVSNLSIKFWHSRPYGPCALPEKHGTGTSFGCIDRMRPLPHACIRVQRPNRQDVETGMHATLATGMHATIATLPRGSIR